MDVSFNDIRPALPSESVAQFSCKAPGRTNSDFVVMLDNAGVTNGGPSESNHKPADSDNGRDQCATSEADLGVNSNTMCNRSQRPAREHPRIAATLQQALQTDTVLTYAITVIETISNDGGSGMGGGRRVTQSMNDNVAYGDGKQYDEEKLHDGDAVEVYRSEDEKFYSSIVSSIGDEDAVQFEYENKDLGDIEADQTDWCHAPTAVLRALSAQILLTSDEPAVIGLLLKEFGDKPFFRRNAQAYPTFVLERAYQREEESFVVTVKRASLAGVPAQATTVGLHVLYKAKHKDDASIKIKKRMASHGNEDQLKLDMKRDRAT